VSDSILDKENPASEYDTTPSHNFACLNHIHPLNIIYARVVVFALLLLNMSLILFLYWVHHNFSQ
jgi:hypothetical protein